MLANYLKIALRNLRKHRGYTALNLLGLAVGLACFILILRYVQFEVSFDRFHEKAARTYRVVQHQPGNMFLGSDRFVVTQAGLSGALRDEFPQVETATTFNTSGGLLSYGDHHVFETEALAADAYFLQVFSFPLLRGDPKTALAAPNTIVLTTAFAGRLFGDEDPVGKTVRLHNRDDYTVTGIVQDPPANSHIQFAFITSVLSERFTRDLDSWGNSSWYTYFVLKEGHTTDGIEARLAALMQKHRGADFEENPHEIPRLYLEPLTSIHLHSHINFDVGENNDLRYLYLLSAVGVVILLLACVNYTNLAVARSIQRLKEVGMRKVVGASRLQLVGQYLGESVLLALLALGLALVLARLALPAFEQWMDRDLALDYAGEPVLLLQLIGLAVLVGLVAGSYPAFVLTALRPASVLKGHAGQTFGRSRLRSVLVVGQYTAAIVLVIGSLVILQQLHFIQTTDVGYEREHVVALRMRDPELHDRIATLKAELQRHPRVVAATATTHLPTSVGSQTTVQDWEGSAEGDEMPIYQLGVDHHFLDVFGIRLAEGRFFAPEYAADTAGAFVLNETAVRRLGWASGVGKPFTFRGQTGSVVGVVEDFHMHSMHQPIEPLVLFPGPSWTHSISVRVQPADLQGTIAHLEETMKQFSPYPVDYRFLDETFDEMYRTEIRLGESVGAFTLLALLIASLGLFGLAAFTAEQRTKEIGVRKVLGATVPQIVTLLSKEFTRLVLVAFVVAAPLAYSFAQSWLANFTYRIEVAWWLFPAAGAAALLIAWLTIAYQTVRAALTNPVQALRYE